MAINTNPSFHLRDETKQGKNTNPKMTFGSDDYDRDKEVKAFDDSKIGVKGLVDAGVSSLPRFFLHPPENLAGIRPPSPSTELQIPAVDLSAARSEVVAQIRDASKKFGFFQLLNHGIPSAVVNRAISAVRSFNELPAVEKSVHYGRGERGGGVSFNTNFDLFQSKAASWRDTLQLQTGPVEPNWDRVPEACRAELREWDWHVRGVGEVVMGLMCEGLGLRTERLKELTCLDGRAVVAHYYPYCPEPDRTLGIGSHTDPGVLTVLVQNEVGGLQVKHGEDWVEVEPLDGALVVNVGDFLQMITNDEYKSVEHRARANSLHDPRVSIAVFFNPGRRGESDEFGPLPELLSPEKPPIYRNFTTPEFLRKFFSKELGGLVNHFKL